jgi:hypothetical protein
MKTPERFRRWCKGALKGSGFSHGVRSLDMNRPSGPEGRGPRRLKPKVSAFVLRHGFKPCPFKTVRLASRSVLALCLTTSLLAVAQNMPMFRWDNFTTANGLPDNHVFCVLVDGKRIWAGTENGLGLYEDGAWKVFRPADGLAHQAVLSLSVDKRTGDLWAGTMGGLSRISAGRIDTFTQLNSGLSNDIVYGVGVQGDFVWAATAAGASRFNTRTGQWALFNATNTPMYEIWTYSVSPAEDKVYYAVWGGGVLEYDVATERWKDYQDPDGETELVVMKDQGLIHEITTSVSYVDKILWVATYFGASRYDGRYWHNFLTKDSGLPSNFLNQVKAVDANRAWFSTDKGLAYYDGANWAVYRPTLDTHKPEMWVRDAAGTITNIAVKTAPAHNYVLGVDFQGDDIWVATAKGLSHGIRLSDTEKQSSSGKNTVARKK